MDQTRDLHKLLGGLTKILQKKIDEELRHTDVNSSNYYYVLKLRQHQQLTQERLLALTGLNASNVTRALSKLELQGVVTRLKEDQDKRKNQWQLTPKGLKLADEIATVLTKIENEFLAPLTKEQRAVFLTVAQELTERSL